MHDITLSLLKTVQTCLGHVRIAALSTNRSLELSLSMDPRSATQSAPIAMSGPQYLGDIASRQFLILRLQRIGGRLGMYRVVALTLRLEKAADPTIGNPLSTLHIMTPTHQAIRVMAGRPARHIQNGSYATAVQRFTYRRFRVLRCIRLGHYHSVRKQMATASAPPCIPAPLEAHISIVGLLGNNALFIHSIAPILKRTD